MSGGGFRVSIPASVKKTIQNIKEITNNHSDEEIYAMLRECSMDPNETTQRLLLQDPFREVKRKRDRKKENSNNKESESRWRSGAPGRGSRGGRGNFSPRYMANDAGSAKNSASGKDSGTNQVSEKGVSPSLSSSLETKNKESTVVVSSVTVMANGPAGLASVTPPVPARSGVNQLEVSSSSNDINKLGNVPSNVDTSKNHIIAFGTKDTNGHPAASSSNCSMLTASAPSSAVCFSSSDPVLMPSNDSRIPGTAGTIKREVGSHRASTEINADIPSENKLTAAPENRTTFIQAKLPSKSQGVSKNQLREASTSSTQGGSSVSRPPSNYSSRLQQIGPQKVGSIKEWKPKQINLNVVQGSVKGDASEVPAASIEASSQPQPISSVLDSEEATSKLHKKLEELHLPQRQHVIIPNHIHVPESERNKFSFGSFDASFGVTSSYNAGPESDKTSTPLSETSQGIAEVMDEQVTSNPNALASVGEEDYPDHPLSPTHAPENLSGQGDVSAGSVPEFSESKQESSLLSGGQHSSVVQTSPNYSFGFLPSMLGGQFAQFENSESQARDVSRLPSFVVQQPIDPTGYYAQFYRAAPDNDGRVSPFPSPGVATKYNGNAALLPPSSQSSQEGTNSLVLTTACPTPLVTQAAGLMQSSIAVTQQPVPVFRPPPGVHIPQYPYIPYGPYFSPYYVHSPAMHQYLSNGAFPQQPQAGSVYPSQPAGTITGVKFSLPQYKPGTNMGNSTHIAMPSGYGTYGSSPAGYNPSSASTTGNSTTNEDLAASQFKESNVYIAGQQSEGSTVWIAAPGRDMSSLPPTSFYNLPPQGQHVTFAPTQAAPGPFSSIYHPAQAVSAATVHPLLQQSQTMAGAVDMVGPAASVYQPPQHAQINWPSSY
ncbi:hypothetical protein SLE2022_119810 [Rubroshorea leprosula]